MFKFLLDKLGQRNAHVDNIRLGIPSLHLIHLVSIHGLSEVLLLFFLLCLANGLDLGFVQLLHHFLNLLLS